MPGMSSSKIVDSPGGPGPGAGIIMMMMIPASLKTSSPIKVLSWWNPSIPYNARFTTRACSY
ncbi:unnamed protein product [Pelagomonas calceolata]|uniref:Uncharacterized protein n=1 Tax=Pelagomonas calceolata TaxID=35677 RepID=A0A8J2SCF9_9STRA|nr:unnamed protein product [Pelagomonas calceolata]